MRFLTICFLVLTVTPFYAQKKTYYGVLGDSGNVELEISTNNNKDYMGRYRFENTKNWILLRGAMYIDRRNRIAQNLVLYEFSAGKDTAVFDLYKEGVVLSGTWQRNKTSPIKEVRLEEGDINRSAIHDGVYTNGENSIEIKALRNNIMEVGVLVKSQDDCPEINMKGTLIKVNEMWKGSISASFVEEEASVVLSFEADTAYLELIPSFIPGSGCEIKHIAYERQKNQ